ncbi:MAG: four helix bundle protein [Candidatus Pacebacteria bacterium]|nr:four helix bundle protein [Candidatus Paceibacterota bacterium]
MNQELRGDKIKQFTDLISWQKSHQLVVTVYKVTEKFPPKEQFGLTSQMRRAAVSITSNIAEGFGRQGYKEKIQFYYIAHGSLTELKNQFLIARDVGFIDSNIFNQFMEKADESHKLLQGLISKSKTFV